MQYLTPPAPVQAVCYEPIRSALTGTAWRRGSTWQSSGPTGRPGSSCTWRRPTESLTTPRSRPSMRGQRSPSLHRCKTTLCQLISVSSLPQSVQEHPNHKGRGAAAGDRRRCAQLRGLPVITDTRPHSEGHSHLPALHRQPGPQTPWDHCRYEYCSVLLKILLSVLLTVLPVALMSVAWFDDISLRFFTTDVRAAREQMNMGGVTYPPLPLQEAQPRPTSVYSQVSSTCSPSASFTGPFNPPAGGVVSPPPHSSYYSGMASTQHPFYNRVSKGPVPAHTSWCHWIL